MKHPVETCDVHNAHGQKPQENASAKYDFFITGDGSPSICLSSDLYRPEAMHHRQGALSESLFIYHGVLTEALKQSAQPKVLSVGLGCGYNEMITVAHFLSAGRLPVNLYIESFEGENDIRQTFSNWILGAPATPGLQTELQKTFEQVSLLVAKHFQISQANLKRQLQFFLQSGQLYLRDWLTADTHFQQTFGVIFFDAFSSQSTPTIWSEEFLTAFLNKASSPTCGLATYAATGSLNRALKTAGFARAEMPGFSGKRQSTRAWKGVKTLA